MTWTVRLRRTCLAMAVAADMAHATRRSRPHSKPGSKSTTPAWSAVVCTDRVSCIARGVVNSALLPTHFPLRYCNPGRARIHARSPRRVLGVRYSWRSSWALRSSCCMDIERCSRVGAEAQKVTEQTVGVLEASPFSPRRPLTRRCQRVPTWSQ